MIRTRCWQDQYVVYTATAHWANTEPNDPRAPTAPPRSDLAAFEAAMHREPPSVPPLHTDDRLRQRQRGEHALAFAFVPHVVVAAPINMSRL